MPVPDPTGPDEPGDPPGEGTTCGYYMGTCEGGSCAGTFACTEAGIREAIAAGAGPHTFGCSGPTTIVTEATILIDNDVELDGGGNISLESPFIGHPLLHVTEGAEAALSGIALHGGAPIENHGSLRLVNVRMSGVGNPKIIGSINSYGQLTVVDSEFLDANAVSGTDISVEDGELALTSSTVHGVWTLGRVLIVDSLVVASLTVYGEADVVNSTLGRVRSEGRTRIVNSTMTPGRTYTSGVPAIDWNGQISVRGSVIIGHCDVEVVSDGYNIESPGDTCGFDQGTDQVNVSADDLKLGPLADNGGPTMTHALEAGSVAIDVIPEDDCVDAEGELLAADQRGEPRFVGLPFGPLEPVGDGCDVGAFELEQ
jgi:hypothetical protein